MTYENELSDEQKRSQDAEHQILLEWKRDMSDKGQTSISERTFYKDLDFKSIKHYYHELTRNYNAMRRLLQVKAENPEEHIEIIKMRLAVFRRMEKMVDLLTFDWLESTASFSGSSETRQEAYEAIIDEIKAAVSSCDPPTDKDQLEMLMIVFKHFVKWLLAESLDYSLGERVDATDPQRYGLQQAQIQAAAGPDAMNKGQQISRDFLNHGGGRGKPFRKVNPPPPQEVRDSE